MRSHRFAFLSLLAAAALPGSAVATERPPQFIVFSFDNCTEIERWRELTGFAQEMNRDGEKVQFTFFVSGTNFLADKKRSLYSAPHNSPGTSRIGFGGTQDDIRKRIEMINLARKQGHEIGSHAVGHFDGRTWSAADWNREFETHRSLFQNIARNNELEESESFTVLANEITGFRAPYLSTSAGLFEAQRQNKFTYDASGVGHAQEWPEKKDGIWRFNLASLKIAGSGKMTLSMDYNFYVADSGAFNDPKRHPIFREQMLNTYMNYLRVNYTGNRAPLHIGHHFSTFQGDVYNQALLSFARSVCGLPEVKCVTYAKLTQFMEGLSPETLAAYRKGDFPRATFPSTDLARAGTQ